jgi:hypothetical protein
MKIKSVREFCDNATGLVGSKDPVLVTRRGRLAGVYFPCPDETMPIELKRELFPVLAEQVRKDLTGSGLSEEDVLADFEVWRKHRRAARRGR